MELTITERLLLLNILPKTANLTTIRIQHNLTQQLGFSEDELKEHEIKDHGDGNVTLNETGAVTDFEFGAKAHGLIVESLTRMDEAEVLTVRHISLCDKFGIGAD